MDQFPGSVRQPRPSHRLIDRMAASLEVVARSRNGLTLTEIAQATGSPLSTVQNIANGLVSSGFLEEHSKRYYLGMAPYVLNLMAGRRVVSGVSHEDLEELRKVTGLTALLGVGVGDSQYYVDYSSTEAEYAYFSEALVRGPLIQSSAGFIIMADMEKRDVWTYLHSLPPSDDWRIRRYFDLLPGMIETGVCIAPGVTDEPADGVAVAIREGGRTVASVSLAGPKDVIAERKDELAEFLRKRFVVPTGSITSRE